MGKVTEEMRTEIFRLNKEGKKLREIAKEVGICHSTVEYHLYPEIRKERIKKQAAYVRNLPVEKRRQINKSRGTYIKNWLIKKYHTDPEFRKAKLEYARSRYFKLKQKRDDERTGKERKQEAVKELLQ